jgi:serine/threonine protein kinase
MPELPLVGADFAGYRLRAVLGRGGMSIVYQAENPRLLNQIALKVLAPHLASDEVFRARFRDESQIAASLNHPNVIPIHDFGDCAGLLYIAMRYVPGTDLGRLIAEHGWLAPQAAVQLLEQAARALDAAHIRGLVHRDVKPGNLLIARGSDAGDPDHVYLADFGITKQVGASTGLTMAGAVLGTVHYVSPEQIREEQVFGAADQYALGCVLYECLTGRAPFEKSTNEAIMWAHVHELPVPPTVLRPDLPPAVDGVIARALAKDPADRYPNCRAFLADARDAIALGYPRRWTPLPSGGFPGPIQPVFPGETRYPGQPVRLREPARPTARDQRTPTADAASSRWPTDHRNGQRPPTPAGSRGFSGPDAFHASDGFRDVPDFRGQVAFDEERPARSRRVRRRGARRPSGRSVAALTAIGVGVAVIAAGGTTAGLILSKASNNIPSSALYTALKGTEQATGMITLSTCQQETATAGVTTNIQCTNPNPAISSVSFVQYSSADELYLHYQQIVKNVAGGKPFSAVQNSGAMCSVTAPDPMGENSWNQSNVSTHSYTATELTAGKVTNDEAMGRVFCTQTPNGSEIVVWTQDSGRVLGYATGGLESHEQVWTWFYQVHYNIIFPGMAPMPSMPPMSTSS